MFILGLREARGSWKIIAEPLKIYQPHLSAAEVKEKVHAMLDDLAKIIEEKLEL